MCRKGGLLNRSVFIRRDFLVIKLRTFCSGGLSGGAKRICVLYCGEERKTESSGGAFSVAIRVIKMIEMFKNCLHCFRIVRREQMFYFLIYFNE